MITHAVASGSGTSARGHTAAISVASRRHDASSNARRSACTSGTRSDASRKARCWAGSAAT